MKRKRSKIWILLAVIAAAVIIFVCVFMNYRRTAITVDVYKVSSLAESYWAEEQRLSGVVTDGKYQDVVLQEGLVESINVEEGQQVHEGDVLLVYNIESFQLTLKSDEAKIASLTGNLEKAKRQLAVYQTLIPAEYAPPDTETVIHHEAEKVEVIDTVDTGTEPSETEEGVRIYYCTADTVVTADYLEQLYSSKGTAVFVMYEDEKQIVAEWVVDASEDEEEIPEDGTPEDEDPENGSSGEEGSPEDQDDLTLASGSAGADLNAFYLPVNAENSPFLQARTVTPLRGTDPGDVPGGEDPTETPTEDPTETPTEVPTEIPTETPTEVPTEIPTETPSDVPTETPTETPSDVPTETPTEEPTVTPEPEKSEYEDWTLGEGILLFGDGTAEIDFSKTHYGRLITMVPGETDWDEIIINSHYEIDSLGNYAYTKAELVQMIEDQVKLIASLDLELRAAKLTYEKDQLTAQTGEVTAAIDGTVRDLQPLAETSVGGTLMTIAGESNYSVTIFVSEMDLDKIRPGTTVTVMTYETGAYVTAEVQEIGTEPAPDMSGGYGVNPNSSFYPVITVVSDPDTEMRVGEWCEAALDPGEMITDPSTEAVSDTIYLPVMYVRSGKEGSYVMAANADNCLEKRFVATGKTIWGYLIEVKSGLSMDDRIAFPYGNTVEEGVAVTDKESPYEDVMYY